MRTLKQLVCDFDIQPTSDGVCYPDEEYYLAYIERLRQEDRFGSDFFVVVIGNEEGHMFGTLQQAVYIPNAESSICTVPTDDFGYQDADEAMLALVQFALSKDLMIQQFISRLSNDVIELASKIYLDKSDQYEEYLGCFELRRYGRGWNVQYIDRVKDICIGTLDREGYVQDKSRPGFGNRPNADPSAPSIPYQSREGAWLSISRFADRVGAHIWAADRGTDHDDLIEGIHIYREPVLPVTALHFRTALEDVRRDFT